MPLPRHAPVARATSAALIALLALAGSACDLEARIDDDGGDDGRDVAPVALPAGNLIANPSFEVDTRGWGSWQGTLSRAARTAPDGGWLGKVSHAAGTAYSIDDAPDTVAASAAGDRYTFAVSVRAASSTASSIGKPIRAVIRERVPGGATVKETAASATLSSGFQRLTVQATATASGNRIEVYVLQSQAVAGNAFYVDALALTRDGTPTTPPPTPPPSGTRPAFGAQFHCMWSFYTDADRRTVLDKLAAAGLERVRIDVSWAGIEPGAKGERSAWYLGMLDRCVDEARARGFDVLVTLWMTPGWANGGKGSYVPPTRPADYADIARAVAARYAGRVAAYEVWNEPDPSQSFFVGTAAQYTELLRAAYPGFKAGDPAAKVVFGGPAANDDDFIAECYAHGAKGSFDVMATHPYQGKADAPPETPDDGNVWWFTHLPAVRALMVANGDADKPIWFTEYGWSTHANWSGIASWQRGVTPEQQADYALRSIRYTQASYPYVEAMYWYKERARPGGADVHQEGFGLLDLGLAERPVLTALRGFLLAP